MSMAEKQLANSSYIYLRENDKWPSQAVDIHHVVVRKSRLRNRITQFSVLVLMFNAIYFLILMDNSVSVLSLCLVTGALLIRLSSRRNVERESIVIIPAFGVQLETHYRSGRAARLFVPVDKILKPVLNECVTPVTCYWSLALLLRDENELTLVFKKLRPPLKMLAPIWKALCAATDSTENLEAFPDSI